MSRCRTPGRRKDGRRQGQRDSRRADVRSGALEARFAAPGYLFGTAPNGFLEAQSWRLRRGSKALAVADGEGRNGVWLAERGLDVLAADFSATALDKARAPALQRSKPALSMANED